MIEHISHDTWTAIAEDVANMLGLYGSSRLGVITEIQDRLIEQHRIRRDSELITAIKYGRKKMDIVND